MKSNIQLVLFFISVQFIITQSVAFAASTFIEQSDSLQILIQNSEGTKRINAQLELAMLLFEKENEQASVLAKSALAEAKQINEGEFLIRAYFILGRIGHELDNINSSQTYLDSALFLANQLNNNWYKSEILLRYGINQHTSGDHLEALKSFNSSIQAGRESGNYRIVGASYSMMGTIFRVNGLYDRAIEYIIKSRLNYEKAGYTEGYAWAAYLLGRIYTDLQLNEKALSYYNMALDTYKELAKIDNNKSGIIICYEQIGLLNLASGNTEEARRNIEYTLAIHQESGSVYGISNAKKNLGRIEFEEGNFTLATRLLSEALATKIEIGDLLSQASIYQYLGLCLVRTGQTEEGLTTIRRGLEKAITNDQKHIQLDIYSTLGEIYSELNKPKEVIACQQQLISIQDSMLLGAVNIKMEQLQGIYELDAKNDQIEELEQQNEINSLKLRQHRASLSLMIAIILLAIIITAVIFIFNRRLRQNNIQLAEANAAKDKFFAIIAHDLRGPTHTQTTLLEHLNKEFDTIEPEELKNLLSLMHKSSENVSTLLDNLLLWAQSQVTKIEIKPDRIQLTNTIKNTLDTLEQSARLKQITITLNTDDQLQVIFDPNMLQTVVRNILSNAIKFTPRGGKITVKTSASEQNAVMLKITDTGIGIEPDRLSKLFDIGTSSSSQGTENEKSNGLGLILVKEFVERNNGTIQIDSKKGKGTTVVLLLPATYSH
ncbi:tetratricopeptide repeat-containing sensor histidine kinase [uncultured Draconibacterium sp.]|uniref:tetratricopeptide repeat-containing sensor histidine kinase n=1 Tax=uncultured Draconibacterium sp. TaxID=1573823 RepID=UPI002AA7FC37|nr:tetratricopeptide repeat-containing sensor histidine kinase [uncultured Draconibacterium sp.]